MNTIRQMITGIASAFVVLGIALAPLAGAQSQSIKIGMCLGISGYLADADQSLRDGATLATEKLNGEGGLLGRKIEYIVEDMRSEPQQAITVINKLIISDKVNFTINGLSSAGNAGAAPLAARNKVPMILGSVLPPPEHAESVRWCFSTVYKPEFEIVTRYGYLQKMKIKKIGIIHDPTPYVTRMKNAGVALAPEYGLTVVGIEQFKVDDTDMKPQIMKLVAAGAEVILKFGTGPSTIVAAKNIRELGVNIPCLAGASEMQEILPSAEALGDRFFVVAQTPQIQQFLAPNDPLRKNLEVFIPIWSARYGKRDPTQGARGWEMMLFLAAGIKAAGSTDGEKVRTALENLGEFAGTYAVYHFTAKEHLGMRVNPLKLIQIINGKVQVVYNPEVEK